MEGRDEATKRAEGPHDRRSEIGGRKTESILEKTGDLAPVYQEEGEKGREGLNRSEKDVEFVNETMRTGTEYHHEDRDGGARSHPNCKRG
jgi:hypothetical protein